MSTPVAESLVLAGEMPVASMADMQAQRPGALVVRSSDPIGFSLHSCHPWLPSDRGQLPNLWA